MKKYLNIDDCKISYSKKDNCFRITSKDKQLKGRPFQITLPIKNNGIDNSTAETLLELFKTSPNLSTENEKLPANLTFPTETKLNKIYENLNLTNWQKSSKVLPIIGETFNNQNIFFNLGTPLYKENISEIVPYTFITGKTGTGKTVLLKTIAKNAAYNDSKAVIITLRNYNEFIDLEDSENIITTVGLMEGFSKLVEIENIAKNRLKLLEETGIRKNFFIDLIPEDFENFYYKDSFDNKPIFLTIDEISDIFYNTPDWYSDAFIKKLTKILQIGKTAGIYVFISTQRVQKELIPNSFLQFFGRRIIMGNKMNYEDTKNFLNVGFDGIPKKMMNPGTGVYSEHGNSPIIFQTFM